MMNGMQSVTVALGEICQVRLNYLPLARYFSLSWETTFSLLSPHNKMVVLTLRFIGDIVGFFGTKSQDISASASSSLTGAFLTLCLVGLPTLWKSHTKSEVLLNSASVLGEKKLNKITFFFKILTQELTWRLICDFFAV